MAEKVAFSIVGKIAVYLLEPIGRQFGYLCCYKSNIENHRSQVEKLENISGGVQLLVDDAKRKGEIVGPDVEAWQIRVNQIKEDAKQVVEAEAVVEKGCLNGWCPNLKLRYSLSRKANKKTREVVELQADGKFNRVSYPAPLVEIPYTSAGGFKGLQSRLSTMKEVMGALKDNEINMIGICGMGGVGKTTMVEEIKIIARNENLFDEVAMTVVSKTPDLFKIQRDFGDMLGLSLVEDNIEVRAKRLHARLTNGNRILVILDDVWEGLDLRKVGIPFGGENKKCKVVLTSRLKHVCSGMETQKDFIVQVLAEQEAWSLFNEVTGNFVDSTNLHYIAKEVSKECGGLPIALVTVGKALKNKEKHAWIDALRQLRRSTIIHIPGMHKNVYTCLELSYNHLESNQAKSLLLLCCLFPEDYDIPIEFLVRYGVGLRLFEDVETVAEARDRVYSLVDELRICNLLLASDKEFAKLHDVVRDVGLSIASKDEHVYMARHDTGLKEWPQKETYEHYTAISLTANEMHKLPAGLYCPKLKLLQLLHNYNSLNIPIDFFGGMKELRVIGFYRITLESPAPLLQFPLTNIRTLCLDFFKFLPDLSIIGSFKNLEILSFFNCYLDELPSEIKQLSNLRLLDLRCSKRPTKIPPGVFSNLYKLEELYLGRNFWKWMNEGHLGEYDCITEVNSLSHLNTLSICIPYPELFMMNFCFEKLMRFGISISRSESDLFTQNRFPNSLRLHGLDMSLFSKTGINVLLRRTEILDLEVKGLKNVLNELCEHGFINLKDLRLAYSSEVEYLIDTTDLGPNSAFINLESLNLQYMYHLKEICHGNVPAGSFHRLQKMELRELPALNNLWQGFIQPDCLGNLRVVDVSVCNAIKSLFTISIIKGLVQLQELMISRCEMNEIVSTEGEDERNAENIFPKLKYLKLDQLPNMRSVFSQKVAFPNLEVLHISEMNNLETIAHGQIPDASLSRLREIKVERCFKLLNFISSNLQPCLRNLEKLSIDVCRFLLVVFESEGGLDIEDEPSTVTFSPQIREMTSECLPKLMQIEDRMSGFVNLRKLVVWDCGGLRNLFSPSIARGLLQLRTLEVCWCKMIEEIVTDHEKGKERIDIPIVFPQLSYLKLFFLLNLNIFCSGDYDFEFPSLTQMIIQACPQMKTFSSGQLSAPKLKRLDINVTGDTIWMGDLNTTVQNMDEIRLQYLMRKREEELASFKFIEDSKKGDATTSRLRHIKDKSSIPRRERHNSRVREDDDEDDVFVGIAENVNFEILGGFGGDNNNDVGVTIMDGMIG